jgi:exodeoxyribonuclease V alpha subunit
VIKEDEPERAADIVVRLVAERIPERFGLDPMKDIQGNTLSLPVGR